MARSPSRAATAETARQQFDWSVPTVMRVSAPCARASPTRNSSLRILLPDSRRPVRSSRFMYSSTPSRRDRRSSFMMGVGARASSMRAGAFIRSSYHSPVLLLQIRGDGGEVVGREDLVAEGAPGLLLHVPVDAPDLAGLDLEVDHETERHRHDPGHELRALGGE